MPHVARRIRLAVALPLLLVSGGCAAASAAWRSGPAGIAAEWAIRDHLTYGRAPNAWAALGDKKLAPSDALLRHLYRGVIALHAGEYEAGSRAMDRAWTIADDRFTRRISTGAASLLTSDATLPYQPLPTEWLMIPYYGALNWHLRGEPDEVAVEARRLAALLARESDQRPPEDLYGVLRYVSGVFFELAGERQDALVAYRNAAALLGTLPGDTTLAGPDSGDVVVLIEDGFVGRPEPLSIGVYMDGDELVGLTSGPDVDRIAVARRVERRSFDPAFDRSNLQTGWLTYEVNWAVPGEPTRVFGQVTALTAAQAFPQVSADVAQAVARDFERELPAKLSRAIARTAVRYAASKAADRAFRNASRERNDDDEDEDDGNSGWLSFFFGLALGAATVTSSVIDQPDLRAWQLLPSRISVSRLRLPVGRHTIRVQQGEREVPVAEVDVRAGGVALITHRVWTAQ